jgi:hypothetical protein
MAKVITANQARAIANKMEGNECFRHVMENIYRQAMLGKTEVTFGRNGQSTDTWEVCQAWLIGLEYQVEIKSNTLIVVKW